MAEHSEEQLHGLFAQLSDRQLEVLRLLASHQTAKEIARTIGRSEHTVRAHSAEVRRRLGVSNTREAAILLDRYEKTRPLVNNQQPQSGLIAPDPAVEAGSGHDHEPDFLIAVDETAAPAERDLRVSGINVVYAGADNASDAGIGTRSQDGVAARGLVWLYVRLKALTNGKWVLLTAGTTIIILLMTAGILAGAGAILETLQEFSVRAR